MGKATKIWLIAASCLVLIGCILFGGMMIKLNWNFSSLSTEKYETNIHRVEEAFGDITVETSTADILFQLSDVNSCIVTCYEPENTRHCVAVEDGRLTVRIEDHKKWYEYIGFHFSKPKITLELPQAQYNSLVIRENTGDIEIPEVFSFSTIDITASTGDIKNLASATEGVRITTSTGNIQVENMETNALTLSVSTGKITASNINCHADMTLTVTTGNTVLTNVQCKNLVSTGDTGDLYLRNVVAKEVFSIERSTGDVKFEGADAAEITVKTDTGRVSGTLLTEKVFITETDTGRIRVPKTISGGKCEITTDTGDILIEIGEQ